MADNKTMYTNMFNAVTDAVSILQNSQLQTEEMFTTQEELNHYRLKAGRLGCG